MKKTVFEGVATAIITPMTENAVDYAAYARRAEKRLRASQMRRMMVAAAETVSTALIGVCFTVCTVLVFTML